MTTKKLAATKFSGGKKISGKTEEKVKPVPKASVPVQGNRENPVVPKAEANKSTETKTAVIVQMLNENKWTDEEILKELIRLMPERSNKLWNVGFCRRLLNLGKLPYPKPKNPIERIMLVDGLHIPKSKVIKANRKRAREESRFVLGSVGIAVKKPVPMKKG